MIIRLYMTSDIRNDVAPGRIDILMNNKAGNLALLDNEAHDTRAEVRLFLTLLFGSHDELPSSMNV